MFFSNVCSETLLRELAAEDEDELVVEVQEYYADVVAMEKNAFTLNLGEMNAASTRRRFSRGRARSGGSMRGGYLERVVSAETTSVRTSSAIE